jgi:hypothetical protein
MNQNPVRLDGIELNLITFDAGIDEAEVQSGPPIDHDRRDLVTSPIW